VDNFHYEMGGTCGTHRSDNKCVKILVGKIEGKKHSEDLEVDRRIILEWIGEEQGGEVWTECI